MPGKRGISSGGFDVQLLFAHKILLATIVIAFVGWWVAFIGQCVAENDVTAQSQLWFAILLHLALIIGFVICIATDSLPLARLQLVAFTAVALVLAARGTNGVYIGASSEKAVGAGYILLLIVDLIWLLYLTSEEGSPFYSILNITNTGVTSPAARDTSRYGGGGSNAPLGGGGGSGNVGDGYNARNNTSGYSNNFNTGSGYQPAYGHSAADITNGDGMGAPKLSNVSMRSRGGADTSNGGVGPTNDAPSVASHGVGLATAGSGPGSVGGTAEYGYKARALYAYQANADDPTEISFTKGEILDIVDNSGKWWQAKKASGETGIVPSNYMQLL